MCVVNLPSTVGHQEENQRSELNVVAFNFLVSLSKFKSLRKGLAEVEATALNGGNHTSNLNMFYSNARKDFHDFNCHFYDCHFKNAV